MRRISKYHDIFLNLGGKKAVRKDANSELGHQEFSLHLGINPAFLSSVVRSTLHVFRYDILVTRRVRGASIIENVMPFRLKPWTAPKPDSRPGGRDRVGWCWALSIRMLWKFVFQADKLRLGPELPPVVVTWARSGIPWIWDVFFSRLEINLD